MPGIAGRTRPASPAAISSAARVQSAAWVAGSITTPTRGRLLRSLRLRSAKRPGDPLHVGVEYGLDVERDRDLVADDHAALVHRRIPAHPEIVAVDRRGGDKA